jgi:antitoxin (DNA-binding transcriptional repressor) of toxin-antitoxin stability system
MALGAGWRRAAPAGGDGGPGRVAAGPVAVVTINSHLMVMSKRPSDQVRIADFKARLSEHLRAVRRGRTLTILDRDTPVAQVVAYRQGELLDVRPPAGRRRLRDIPLPPPLSLPFDIVTLLLEERQGER